MDENQQPQKTLSTMDRIILQNIFDTQEGRRAAYLKKIGFEMNPNNDNEYRPLGSDTGYSEIDPGFYDEFKKGGLAAAGKEFLKDAGDIAGDMALGAGAASLGPLGVPALIMANAAGEGVKVVAGDILLDENVPVDKTSMALQSLFAGIAPKILQGGKSLAKEGYDIYLRKVRDSIVNAAKSSGGGLNEEILNKAVKNPEMFSKEAVAGAGEKLKGLYRSIFGMEDPLEIDTPNKIKAESAFGKAIAPIKAQADSEVERLAKEPAASFSLPELIRPIAEQASALNDLYEKSDEQKYALNYLKGKVDSLRKKAAEVVTEKTSKIADQFGNPIQEISVRPEKKINFKEAREFLSAIQSDLSNQDNLKFLSPAFNGETGVLSILNKKAENVGSDLPVLNHQIHRTMKAYNTAVKAYSPSSVQNTFIGNQGIKKLEMAEASKEIDDILGTNFTKMIEDGSMQKVVENLYKNPKSFGSGRVNAEIVKEAASSGLKGAGGGFIAGSAVGAPTAGAVIGGAVGAARGAQKGAYMAAPERAIEKLGSVSNKISQSEANLMQPSEVSIPESAVVQMIGRQSKESSMPEQNSSSFDPLEDFDPLKDFNE